MTDLAPTTNGSSQGGGGSSDLAEVVSTILDKGLVIDAQVTVSLVGIRLLSIDARVVVASVDTYLRFAEAANRLDLSASNNDKGLPDLVAGPKGGLIEKAGDALGEIVGGGSGDRDRERVPRRRRQQED